MMNKIIMSFSMSVLILSMCIVPANATNSQMRILDESIKSEQETIQYFLSKEKQDWYGGTFYDGETLVVNYVKGYSVPGDVATIKTQQNIEYREVECSLRVLEDLKKTLEPYMETYLIAVLDANEITNKIDIALYDYTRETMESICSIIPSKYNHLINFIDFEEKTILESVATEPPPNYNPMRSLFSLKSTAVLSGDCIKIGTYYYTFGPAKSSTVGYTAGHLYSGTKSVYNTSYVLLGTVTSRFGGSLGDSGKITMKSGGSCAPVVNLSTPIAGRTVAMFGATSGKTTGTISQTNLSINWGAPTTTLTGMCSATYPSAEGDSGAAVFNGSGTVSTSYGVQSCTLFDANNNFAGFSYFTPSSKFAS